ncbi:Uu.00g085090.m01.CDS01 [Anthostomella pinea]|uniref:Uu.00g085090.m01.CDS01 n=1 Tax=Anthostomella pinea TaxID=933095 RepID=A0AAI8YJW7_9PEZI|nr:Uu.00g085090.m01.CDS01 [Anthostomella pinea]
MDSDYPIPPGLHAIPAELLDLRPDAEVDHDLLHPKPVSDSEKNIWFFWHSGYANMHPYTQRNIRAWHRRFFRHGWTIRVMDRQPGSPLNVANYLDIADTATFPRAFVAGTIGGDHAPQHTSDMVRFPLLLRYGGVYVDVGLMQIGDLDRLWSTTVGDPTSRYELLSYGAEDRQLTNYFLAARRDNPLFARAHRLLLALWAADGGKTSTDGLHRSAMLAGVPLQGQSFGDATSRELTDYIIQGQVLTLVMGLVDEQGGWNGPEYCARHIYAIEYMVGSQLINEYTDWDGPEAFRLMSLRLPARGEAESAEQKRAREVVEGCLGRSFGFKLAHGLILKVMGETLGSLWRSHEGADDVPGTYAHWLRHGTIYWNQDDVPPGLEFEVIEPYRTGPLLGES